MRILRAAFVCAACACAAEEAPGQVVRLSAGASDTVIVNSRWPTAIPVRALDAAGRAVARAPIRFEHAGGDALSVSTGGEVTCNRASDVAVRAVLGRLVAHVLVRCRPVRYVRIPGPIQFILGDSARSRPLVLPVEAYGPDGRRVRLIAGTVRVYNRDIATLRGRTLHPRSRGITLAGAHVGDGSAAIGVHVYTRVDTLAALDTLLRVRPGQRLFAVPLRLERGEFRRQRLPPGGWMLTMLPEHDDPSGLHLRIEGATCQSNLLNSPRRFGCRAGPNAAVIVYRPFGTGGAPVATGDLLVRWLFS